MVSKTVKISDENYIWLLHLASELQRRNNRPVSFDEVIYTLKEGKMKEKKEDLMSFAGKWKMSDRDAKKFLEVGKKGWKKWKIPSV